MSRLDAPEFIARCNVAVTKAVPEYIDTEHTHVSMDTNTPLDEHGEPTDEHCQMCRLPVSDFPTKPLRPLVAGYAPIETPDRREYVVIADGIHFDWTVCPNCMTALSEHVPTRKEVTA